MSSIRANLFRRLAFSVMGRIDPHNVDIERVRRLANSLSLLSITAFGVNVEKTTVNGLKAEWLVPEDSHDGKVMLYLHGGGYVVGGCDMHRQLVSHLARAGRVRALLPEYRLAPEHKFPAAVDDCIACYEFLLADGYRPEDIVLGGDSAGGGLVLATLLGLRDAQRPLPAAAILLSPFLDMTGSGRSITSRASRDPIFHHNDMSIVAEQYCLPHQVRFPQVSPVFADIEGLPPMYIQVGDDEILLSDSERLADQCVAAGIDVQLEVWPGMWHVFQLFTNKMPESRRAIAKFGDYIQAQLA